MSDDRPGRDVIDVGGGFWNIRGSFKLGGLIDVGTQASLVRRKNGKYLLLDACAFSEETRRWIDRETNGGAAIEAVLHLHPFHTVSVRQVHRLYPNATLYGTARHLAKLPDLPWSPLRTEEPELHARWADDLAFSVPRGVAFVPDDERLHFSSVLAFHPASKTLHVDDTITHLALPRLVHRFKRDVTMLHPSLARVLEPRAGAAAAFRAWARELVERCGEVENLCAAHSSTLLGRDHRGPSVAERIEAAIAKVEPKLAAHERKHG